MNAITDDLLNQLVNEPESNSLDFKKEQYNFIKASDDDKSELLKDIVAFANSFRRDDAFILIGFQEVKGNKATTEGISEDIDDANLQQFVHTKLKKGIVYLRRGTSTGQATPEEIALMGVAISNQTQSKPVLEILFNNNQNVINFEVSNFEKLTETDLEEKLNQFKEKFKTVPKPEKKEQNTDDAKDKSSMLNPITSLITGAMINQFASIFNDIYHSEEKISIYNNYLKGEYDKYEIYLKNYQEYLNSNIGVFEINLQIVNSGIVSADDIDVHIHFPDGFDVVKYISELEKPIEPKEPLSYRNYSIQSLSYDWLPTPFKIPVISDILYTKTPRVEKNITLKEIRKTNSYDVEFIIKKVKHHKSEKLNTLYLIFDNFESVNTFDFEYQINADNLSELVIGKLSVIINKI